MSLMVSNKPLVGCGKVERLCPASSRPRGIRPLRISLRFSCSIIDSGAIFSAVLADGGGVFVSCPRLSAVFASIYLYSQAVTSEA